MFLTIPNEMADVLSPFHGANWQVPFPFVRVARGGFVVAYSWADAFACRIAVCFPNSRRTLPGLPFRSDPPIFRPFSSVPLVPYHPPSRERHFPILVRSSFPGISRRN